MEFELFRTILPLLLIIAFIALPLNFFMKKKINTIVKPLQDALQIYNFQKIGTAAFKGIYNGKLIFIIGNLL